MKKKFLVHRVRVGVQKVTTGDGMGVARSLDFEVPATPCRVVPATGDEKRDYAQRGVAITHMVYFGDNPELSEKSEVLYQDRRILEFRGAFEPDELGVYWKGPMEERSQPYG